MDRIGGSQPIFGSFILFFFLFTLTVFVQKGKKKEEEEEDGNDYDEEEWKAKMVPFWKSVNTLTSFTPRNHWHSDSKKREEKEERMVSSPLFNVVYRRITHTHTQDTLYMDTVYCPVVYCIVFTILILDVYSVCLRVV